MPRSDVETLTETTTAHKISVALMVATATLVLVSAVAAALYTLSRGGTKATVITTNPQENVPVIKDKDRVLKTPPDTSL